MKNQRQQIGIRIRGLRESAELRLDETARKLDLTTEEYGRYEAGEADVSLSLVSRLASLFNVDSAAILTGGDSHARVFSVTRRGAGPVVSRRQVYHYESLGAGFSRRTLEPFVVTVQPGEDGPPHLNSHPGQEFNRVMKGRLKLVIDGHEVILKTGDSVYFDSSRPHGMQALDGKPAQFLAVITHSTQAAP